jgi:hypothetical protein
MGGDSEIESGISDPEASDSFPGSSLLDRVEYVRIRHFAVWACLHFLHPGLGVVEGQGQETGQEPSHRTRHDPSELGVFLHVSVEVQVAPLLGFVVRTQHPEVQHNSSDHSRSATSPQVHHAFFSNDFLESLLKLIKRYYLIEEFAILHE